MLKDVLRDILAALPAIEAEDMRLEEKHGIDTTMAFNLFDTAVIARAFDENRPEKDLEKILVAHDHESLLLAEALLYYGRDNQQCAFQEKLDYLRGLNDSKTELVRTIMEKRSAFRRYVGSALEKLETEGLTVEDI